MRDIFIIFPESWTWHFYFWRQFDFVYTRPYDSGIMVSHWTSVCQLYVWLSVRFFFQMITWVKVSGLSPNLVSALILWRSGLGLLMGKFRQILAELSARNTPIFLFPDNNLSKHQCIFTKFGMCIDIMKIWFGIANGQTSSDFDSYLSETRPYFHFPDDNLSKYQGILTKLGTCIDMKEIWFGIAYGQISSMFDRVICRDAIMAGYYSLMFLLFGYNTVV